MASRCSPVGTCSSAEASTLAATLQDTLLPWSADAVYLPINSTTQRRPFRLVMLMGHGKDASPGYVDVECSGFAENVAVDANKLQVTTVEAILDAPERRTGTQQALRAQRRPWTGSAAAARRPSSCKQDGAGPTSETPSSRRQRSSTAAARCRRQPSLR